MPAVRRIAIGLMSGTSADGVDAVACEVRGAGEAMRAVILAHVHLPYSNLLRDELLAIMAPAATRTETLCRLDVAVAEAFAAVARRVMRAAGLTPRRVAVIGSHGQTICHLPERGATLQIGRGSIIAQRTGVPVVSDFRAADMAVGGEGAPLVPWTDWVLLRDARRARAIQNIGGIANVTLLAAGTGPERVIAFDTGPGNMVMDELAHYFSRGRQAYDRGGRLAMRGAVCEAVLREWLSHPYLSRRPPKSCGREEFGRAFVASSLRRHARLRLSPADWLATAAALTVESIARACERWLPRGVTVGEVVVCGGGARNTALMKRLAARVAPARVRRIDEFGIASAAKEALSFALLACAHLDGVPANLPRVTGARRRVVLGQFAPAESTK